MLRDIINKDTAIENIITVEEKMEKHEKTKLTRKQLVEMKIQSKFKKAKSLIEGKRVIKTATTPKQIVQEEHITQRQSPGTDLNDIMNKVQQLKSGKKSTPYNRIEQNTTNTNTNDPTVLMESVGMKNPKIQQIMLAKATELGGDGEKGLTEALKKLLGIGVANPYSEYGK